MIISDDEEKAQYHLQTFIEAEPGKTIKGEDVAKLVKQSKKTGIPIAKLARNLEGVTIQTVVTPENLIESTLRKKRKR